MKTFNTVALLLYSIITLGQNSDKLTAKQILDSSIEFCGGEKRIAEIELTSISYLLTLPDKTTEIIHEKRKVGHKFFQSSLSKKNVPKTTFYDGKNLSKIIGSSVKHVEDLGEIEEIKLKTYNQIQYGYKKLNYKLTRLPDGKLQNFDCYVIKANTNNEYSIINYFNKTDFRLLMVVYPNGNKSVMAEYILKEGVLYNSNIVNIFPNTNDKHILKLQKIHLDNEISDLWFTCPYKDIVSIPSHIKFGKFKGINGHKTTSKRDDKRIDIIDQQGKRVMRRNLRWVYNDTYRTIKKNKQPETLYRIISWDDKEFVSQWLINEQFGGTQDYMLVK